MSVKLPADCLEFLRSGRTLSFDVESSEIGPISLVSADEVREVTVNVFPGCQELDYGVDLYDGLDGQYAVPIINLIAESERYDAKGLFCWIPALAAYGSVDCEHGTVRYYPETNWHEIEQNPLPFLDGQWNNEGVVAKPWLHFPFCIYDPPWAHEPKIVVPIYPETCPIHGRPVTARNTLRPEHFGAWRERVLSEWFEQYLKSFPCSGLATDEGRLLCCTKCRNAENRWLKERFTTGPVIEVRANSAGYVECPGCGIRFSIRDPERHKDGMHTTCGQRIVIVD